MGRGRRKQSVHPGQSCGPCHLCHSSSIRYCHIGTWADDLRGRIKEIAAVSDNQCICRACESDFKLNSGRDGYRFRWMPDPGNAPGSNRCIVASCTETGCIIHTAIAKKEKIADLLHEQVLSTRHIATPLCTSHYRQVHRLLHSGDKMYAQKLCCTCNAWIRGISRHSPNAKIVRMYFGQYGIDTPLTDNDYICTACYNYHLLIVHSAETNSTDSELEEQLRSEELPVLCDKYPKHIAVALKEIISKVGEVLMKKIAVLFPDVYKCFITLVIKEAAEQTSESEQCMH